MCREKELPEWVRSEYSDAQPEAQGVLASALLCSARRKRCKFLAVRIERTANFCGHFDAFLDPSPSDKSWIKSIENFAQRQRHHDLVAIDFGREYSRSCLAQITEGNLYGAASELGKNFLQGDQDSGIADIRLCNARLQLQGQAGQDRLKRQFEHPADWGSSAGTAAILMKAGLVSCRLGLGRRAEGRG